MYAPGQHIFQALFILGMFSKVDSRIEAVLEGDPAEGKAQTSFLATWTNVASIYGVWLALYIVTLCQAMACCMSDAGCPIELKNNEDKLTILPRICSP